MLKKNTVIYGGIILILFFLLMRSPIVRGILYENMRTAVKSNNYKKVKLLLFLGADPDGDSDYKILIDNQGLEFSSHLLTAVSMKDNEMLKLLLKSKPDINLVESDETTALRSAISLHNIDAVRLLLEAGAEPRYYDDYTAVVHAKAAGFPDLIPIVEPYLHKNP